MHNTSITWCKMLCLKSWRALKINWVKYFTLLADEAKHFSKKEQVVVEVRFWHENTIHEEFIGKIISSGSACVSLLWLRFDSNSMWYLTKITLVTFEKSVVQFVPTKHRRFSPGSPVVTLDLWGVALTGSLGRTAYIADWVIQDK